MNQRLKNRSDLRFREQKNIPEPVEFDYEREVTEKDIQAIDRSMMAKSGLSGAELHKKLTEGILISGEEW